MTAEEKSIVACFIDLFTDYLDGGYKRQREPYSFEDDTKGPPEEAAVVVLPALPLVYLEDEAEEALDRVEDNVEHGAEAASFLRGEYWLKRQAFGAQDSHDSLEQIAGDISACSSCDLCGADTFAVCGEGARKALALIVGGVPDEDEERVGRPFTGKPGELLDKMLVAIGLYRDKNCFITHAVKCRPRNRKGPLPEESEACFTHLKRQITLLEPKAIFCVGSIAAFALLDNAKEQGITTGDEEGPPLGSVEETLPVLVSFHPEEILQNDSLKRPAWEDLKRLRALLASRDNDYAAAGERANDSNDSNDSRE